MATHAQGMIIGLIHGWSKFFGIRLACVLKMRCGLTEIFATSFLLVFFHDFNIVCELFLTIVSQDLLFNDEIWALGLAKIFDQRGWQLFAESLYEMEALTTAGEAIRGFWLFRPL
jgi:hypothetical protein